MLPLAIAGLLAEHNTKKWGSVICQIAQGDNEESCSPVSILSQVNALQQILHCALYVGRRNAPESRVHPQHLSSCQRPWQCAELQSQNRKNVRRTAVATSYPEKFPCDSEQAFQYKRAEQGLLCKGIT